MKFHVSPLLVWFVAVVVLGVALALTACGGENPLQDDLDRANARALKAEQDAKKAGEAANGVLDAAAKMRIDARVIHEQAAKIVRQAARKQVARGLITGESTADEIDGHFGIPGRSNTGFKSPRGKPSQCDYFEGNEGGRMFQVVYCYELPEGGGAAPTPPSKN